MSSPLGRHIMASLPMWPYALPTGHFPILSCSGAGGTKGTQPRVTFHSVMRKKHSLSLEDIFGLWPGQIPAITDTQVHLLLTLVGI